MSNLLENALVIDRYKKRVRVGRGVGSGLGKTAGRGAKGAFSRSGSSRKGAFEGGQKQLFRRVAKRGFNNRQFQSDVLSVSLRVAKRVCGNEITSVKLKDAFGGSEFTKVKIYGTVPTSGDLTIDGCSVTQRVAESVRSVDGVNTRG